MPLVRIWDRIRTSLWFRPAGWVLLFGALAFVLTAIDNQTGGVYTDAGIPWYFRGGPDGARTILSIIGSGVLTVTSLTFSIIMVAVVQTANAYSPRILNDYLAEPAHQHVLGILVGTFLYTLLVLWDVRSIEDGVHVPSLSVTFAIILSLVSVGAFIFFIHYVSHSISVGNIVSLIVDESEESLETVFPETLGEGWRGDGDPRVPDGEPATLAADGSGYVTYIDGDRLLAAAAEHDIVVHLEKTIGDYVFHDVPLATVTPAEVLDEDLNERLHDAFQLGKERELRQNFLYGVRQLTDIAVRALSPGINDPSTAEQCIDALVNLIGKLARHTPVSPYRCDDEGNVRIVVRSVTLAEVLQKSFGKMRAYASGDPTTLERLIRACGELGYATNLPADQVALWSQVTMLASVAERSLSEKADREAINEALWQAADILEQDPQPLLLGQKPA